MRDTVICFRTNERLRKALQEISEADKRSLTSVVEDILYDFVRQQKPNWAGEERRRRPRVRVSTPALLTTLEGISYAGMLNDLSLDGIGLSVPNSFPERKMGNAALSVVFVLPTSEKPLAMECVLRHVRSDVRKKIGGCFVNADFESCVALQDHVREMTSVGRSGKNGDSNRQNANG